MSPAGDNAWVYTHRDLGEHVLPDGSQIRRPCVLVSPGQGGIPHLGVVDSGSPITVADPAFLASAGVNTETDHPVMRIPFGMGASFGSVPIYEITIGLVPPDSDHRPLSWRALVGARSP